MSFDWYFPIFDHIGEPRVPLKKILNSRGMMYFLERSYLKRKLVRRK